VIEQYRTAWRWAIDDDGRRTVTLYISF